MLKLVGDVLANAPAALNEACSCRGILAGLESVGAFDVLTLQTLLEQDHAEVKLSKVLARQHYRPSSQG